MNPKVLPSFVDNYNLPILPDIKFLLCFDTDDLLGTERECSPLKMTKYHSKRLYALTRLGVDKIIWEQR